MKKMNINKNLNCLLGDENSNKIDHEEIVQESESMQERLKKLAISFGEHYESDVLIYSGNIGSPADVIFREKVKKTKKYEKVILWISTYGGLPDSAYRIAKALQGNYKHIVVLVDRYCKSSGTLISLVANEVWMTDSGEFGPLDIQLMSKDEFNERNSGLDALTSLDTLCEKSGDLLRSQFLNTRMGGMLSTKQSLDVASRVTVGLMSKIYEQIEPLRLGEIARSMRIAFEYGQRLNQGNLQPSALSQLVVNYPSHGYVIDFDEAKDRIFSKIALVEDDLIISLIHMMNAFVTERLASSEPLILALNEFIDEDEINEEATTKEEVETNQKQKVLKKKKIPLNDNVLEE